MNSGRPNVRPKGWERHSKGGFGLWKGAGWFGHNKLARLPRVTVGTAVASRPPPDRSRRFMADSEKVEVKRMTISHETGALRLCLEGFVLRSLCPRLDEAAKLGSHLPPPREIEAAYPKLIPALHLRETER